LRTFLLKIFGYVAGDLKKNVMNFLTVSLDTLFPFYFNAIIFFQKKRYVIVVVAD